MFYQSAIVKNEDLIRVYNCTEAVGDHNNRLAFHQFGNRLLNQNFILRVKGCCCFVKQNNGRIFQQGAGDGNTLALTTGKRTAIFTEDRLIPVRHLPDKFITIGGFGSSNYLIVCCVWIRFLYNGIIIKHQKTEPTYTKTSLFLCEKRRFFMARREKGVVPIIYFEKERGKSF